MNFSPESRLRLGTAIFAGLLGLAGVWILSVEIIRPTLPFFPSDAAAAEAAAAHRSAAGVAASIGLVRGDLWADYAMTLAPEASVQFGGAVSSTAPEAFDNARAAAIASAELAPHDSRVWLLLAGLDARRNGLTRNVAGPLKMSYYTGPNELALIPSRLGIATRSTALIDPELQILVAGEIRTIVTRRPELKPLIIAAYRSATPDGKNFVQSTLAGLDPALLTALRAVPR